MVNIDTVYQKVLALANKEQRGYITPQEFNLLVDKTQKDIINNYFHNVKTSYYKPKNQTEGFDETEMLNEKLHYLRYYADANVVNPAGTIAWLQLPNDLYKIATLMWKSTSSSGVDLTYPIEIKEVDKHVLLEMLANPLTKPSYKRPVYVNSYQQEVTSSYATSELWINLYPFGGDTPNNGFQASDVVTIDYWRIPQKPSWGFVVVDGKALYNASTSKHILLHPSEEENIVTRILELAGIVIKDPTLTQMAYSDKMNIKQEQNS